MVQNRLRMIKLFPLYISRTGFSSKAVVSEILFHVIDDADYRISHIIQNNITDDIYINMLDINVSGR